MEEIKKTSTGFPSDFLDPTEKAKKTYALAWARAMEDIGTNGTGNGLFPGFMENTSLSRFAIWRAYARGNQPIDKYKPILGVNDRKQKKDATATSYRVLNWEILDVASKYVNVLVGRLLKQNNDIGVYAVDKRAQDDRRKKRIELQEYVINQSFLDSVTKQTGIPFEAPLPNENVPPPQNMGEVDVFMEKFYKEEYCLAVQDLLKILNENDNFNEILADVARDLVEIKTAATKVYRVRDKIIRRKCIIERMGCSSSNKNSFEDIKWIFEDWDLTIGQLKEIAGDQLNEKQYQEIAEKSANTSFSAVDLSSYYKQNLCYPWDNTKITVKDCVWFSPDWQTEQIDTNSFGNMEIQRKNYDWWDDLSQKGVTEESFNKKNKSRVVRYPLDNQYQCLWVKGTDHVVNYGKSKDMLKNQSNMGKTIGPYTVYQLSKSIMETIIPTLDNIQIQWLQFQHHAAKSVPAGQAIEFTALQDISIEGAGGKKISPKQALQIYFETGILLWRRRDAAGNLSNFQPIQELAGGISNAMEKHFNYIIQGINLLRDQIGLNELTDASTPNSEMGKAVATMASGASQDALRSLHFAFDQINLGTQKRTVMHISGMAASGVSPQYTEALGIQASALLTLLSDLTIHELGVYLQKAPTEEVRMWINEYCKVGIQNGTLYEEEAFEIQNEPNIYRSIKLLKTYRQEKTKQKQADMQSQYQAESQKNIESIQASAQAKQAEFDAEIAMEQQKAQLTVWANKQKAGDEAFLLNLQSKNARGEAYTAEEQRRITEMMKIDRQGYWQVQVAKNTPKPSPSKAKK